MSRKYELIEHTADIFIKAYGQAGAGAFGAYKKIDEVVKISHYSGIARKVVRVKSIGVVKG